MPKDNVAIVDFKELSDPKENPTFCLSALRALTRCHQCDIFNEAYNSDTIGKLKCKPHLTNDNIDLLKKKRHLLDQLAIINAALQG